MVTERRRDDPHRDIRSGGVAARFRPLADIGDVPDGHPATSPDGAAPPVFGTAPWGYRRSEVDSWASWVAALVAHGRNDTVRADSAEATLKATLERLEQLQRGPAVGEQADRSDGEQADGTVTPDPPSVGVLPRRIAAVPTTPDTDESRDASGHDRTDGPERATEPRPAPAPGPAGTSPTRPDRITDHPELARLQVVETTLHEVMTLLHRLAGPEKS
ncbi:hypothetical protein EV383_1127 [Pseudonocardia sediminis]|uniref:Uncharacterized protein n=1 Tax=Pseudonocardia sediminis TaxID=1397368 RepID=A0A4Q7UW41_PSEST|nr:hypothetical protein [Pseudonocardia sediminis]RZT84289.1 hypothetical protein EV383_1127 [Pseudonocardia sediminis]